MTYQGVMLLYNNVAELRQFRGAARFPQNDRSPCPLLVSGQWAIALSYCFKVFSEGRGLIPAAINLNIQVPDLFPQRIAIDAEKIGGADLISPGRRESSRQQRIFNLT